MDDRVLEQAGLALRRRLVSPLRIEGTDRIAERAFALVVDVSGRRLRLVFDVDPAHPTLHFEPVPRREDWRGGFAQRLRGTFLVDARVFPGERRIELDIAVRTITPTFRLCVGWHGRGGNLWLVELGPGGTGTVVERLVAVGPEPGTDWTPAPPDPRPRLSAGLDLAPAVAVLAPALAEAPRIRWLREITRRLAVSRPQAWQALVEVVRGRGSVESADPERSEALAIRGDTSASDTSASAAHAEFAAQVLARLADLPPFASTAYRLPSATPLTLGTGGAAITATAAEWGLPEAWVGASPLSAFAPFEVDAADVAVGRSAADRSAADRGGEDPSAVDHSAADRGAADRSAGPRGEEGRSGSGSTGSPDDDGRLFWLLSRAHRHLLRAEVEGRRRAVYAARLAADAKRIAGIGARLRGELSDEEGPELRLYGEVILAHLSQIRRGDPVLVCPNLHDPDGPEFRIPLDPARPATEVAESYFKRARRWEKGREMRATRLGHVERALTGLDAMRLALESASELSVHEEFEAQLREATGPFYRGPQPDPAGRTAGTGADGGTSGRRGDGGTRPERGGDRPSGGRGRGSPAGAAPGGSAGGTPRGSGSGGGGSRGATTTKPGRAGGPGREGESRFRPRIYTTSEGWTVVVGRSNLENDYVSLKVAKQDDYWFHAHGVPGSHVVLKRDGRKDNPSKKTIEEAAAIAAFYSKARNSSRAPVIYTLGKYVSKPRKAKPGLVTCTRETSIMVRPSNPEPDTPPEWEE